MGKYCYISLIIALNYISTIILNENPDIIIKAIFWIWISVYGSAQTSLTDKGGESANNEFIELCGSLGTKVKMTSTESPWANSLIEQRNLILEDMLVKILKESNCDLDLALIWSVYAKNSLLTNIHAFSQYQLAIGTNPKLSSIHKAKAPALTKKIY